MDLSLLFLAIPLFFILYNAAELFTGGRKRKNVARAGEKRGFQGFLYGIGNLGLNQAILDRFHWRDHYEKSLLAAGHPYGWKAEEVMAIKELGLVFAAVLVAVLDLGKAWMWPAGLGLGFFGIDLWLRTTGQARRVLLQRQLPGYVDLLSLSLESGLDLLISTERIHEKMKPGPLKDELQTMVQEYRLGTSRKDVLKRWSQRLDLPDALSLTSLIVQSDEIGGDLPTVLRNYAEDMRTRRFLRAEEEAGKIPVKILFPMIIFFFPIVFVIILGPLALEFLHEK